MRGGGILKIKIFCRPNNYKTYDQMSKLPFVLFKKKVNTAKTKFRISDIK